MLNLILIDDDPDEAYIMRQALKKVDDEKTLTHFDDGREFVASIDGFSNSNSLVLLDLNMPQCGGFDVLKLIKKNKNATNLPVVIYSNSNSPHDIELSYQYGANSYVRKPQGLNETIEFLSSLLNYWQRINKT
ncbi:response regulator [Pseudoalteromonas spongiae]|uniref:response regulator n=1 Tax=Pseudoalteromonas spongiae TaxID=298657 RepID=UPI00110AE7F8|nr:response regulator [Pseudoalteromonas spongiae]TMO88486.1 two-component system response regulator [Pseudoalteromonas spongiae]